MAILKAYVEFLSLKSQDQLEDLRSSPFISSEKKLSPHVSTLEGGEHFHIEEYRDRSPIQSPEKKKSHITITFEDDDSITSDLFPLLNDAPHIQPEPTYNTRSLASLSGAIPISPLKVNIRILDETTRTRCLKELIRQSQNFP